MPRALGLPFALALLFGSCGGPGTGGAAATGTPIITPTFVTPAAEDVIKARHDALRGYGDYDGPSRWNDGSGRPRDPYSY
jgi:hypothetical protein